MTGRSQEKVVAPQCGAVTFCDLLPQSWTRQVLCRSSSHPERFFLTAISYPCQLSKSAKEYSIHSASLDGDEFRIVGVSPTITSCYIRHSSLKLKFSGSGRKSAR